MKTIRRFVVAVVAVTPAFAMAQAPTSLSDSAFAALSARLSEAGGFFDTDNLISNEDSYLLPLTTLRRLGTSGGAYVGVGPDQNFSYIAAVRPHIAFIVDIRRDNLLEHLLFKSIFATSRNRVDYLSFLFGKVAPADSTGWSAKTVEAVFDYVSRAPRDSSARARVLEQLVRSPMKLSAADLQTIARFHGVFITEGPSLRFNSLGRAPQSTYPDYRRLAVETDRDGKQASFLSTEERFQFMKGLEDRNLLVPVVGDFGGSHALAAVADWMTEHRENLSAFYTSNVEQYLIRDGGFDAFAKNVRRLPRDAKSVIIRSCFVCRGGHDQAVSGYSVVQVVQLANEFLTYKAAGRLLQYTDVVTLGLVPP